MTWVGYVIFFALSGSLLVGIINYMPGHKVKVVMPKRKPRAEVDPWAGWKEIKANLDASRTAEHKVWQEDFDRLVQASCAHSYPATGSSPTYFTCWKCKYEEPWDGPHEGCTCTYETVTTFSSPFPEYRVTHRHGNCMWHGLDWENFGKHSDRSNRPFKSVRELYG